MIRSLNLLEEPALAPWRTLVDGEARPTLPRSSRIEQVEGSARFRFCLEVNQGEKLGPVGFVRAEAPLGPLSFGENDALSLSLTKTDALFRLTIYLRSSASDIDLQYITELTGPQTLPIHAFRFVKWGSEITLSSAERSAFLKHVNAFGLQIARSRQAEEFHGRPFAGEFGLEGPVRVAPAD